MTSSKYFIILASFLGLSGLILDAFGAHALRTWLFQSPSLDSILLSWQTAVRSQLLHALLLLCLVALDEKISSRWRTISATCLIFGIIFFSGSIYVKVLLGFQDATKIAPLGGLLLMLGWVSIGLGALFKKSRDP